MASTHHFTVDVRPDAHGSVDGVSERKGRRRHLVESAGKAPIVGSAAPAFHGEASRWNPEELFVASLAQCHLLSLFYVVDREGLELVDYSCRAEATLEVAGDGAGAITLVILTPRTVVPAEQEQQFLVAHEEAHRLCFIARSVACEVRVEPHIVHVSPGDTQL